VKLLVLLPLLVAAGAWGGAKFGGPASLLHPEVKLAENLARQEGQPAKIGVLTPDERAIERVRENPEEVFARAADLRRKHILGSTLFGGWIGLVIGIKLISLSIRRKRTDYEPDRGDCFACARCFEYCPNELVRRGFVPALTFQQAAAERATAPEPAAAIERS
jgi:ferredoxin